MSGHALCEHLPWDSEFFGHRIARVAAHRVDSDGMADILSWCEVRATECLYFLADMGEPESVRLAEDHGFRLVDIRVALTRELSLSDSACPPTEYRIGPVSPEEIPHLVTIASTSYHDSRFYHDAHFPRERCDALYETWIEKSCRGFADVVLVARDNLHPLGYVSCHLVGPNEGQIGLVGVDREAGSQGIGRGLVDAALDWLRDAGAEKVTVVTQGRNVRAQRLYQRCGFVTQSMQLWYHRWFPDVRSAG